MRGIARLARLPVVAMTANAMEQDRRKCIEAGMNDFVVKPIDPAQLCAVLLRWIRPGPGAAAVPVPAPAPIAVRPAAAGGLPRDIPGLDTALGLSRMLGKEPLYLAMLRRYAAGQKDAVARMRGALAEGDAATAERLARTLKGVSGSVGAVAVQDLAAAVESALRQSAEAGAAQAALARLEQPLAQLMGALEARLGGPPGADAQSSSAAAMSGNSTSV